MLGGMARIQRQTQQTAQTVDLLSRSAQGFAVAAGVVAFASLKAYDSFARFEQGAKSLLGTLEGKRFARAIQDLAVPSPFQSDLLRKGAQGLISTGLNPARATRVLSATSNLAAAGGSTNEEFSRTMLALRQIQTKGFARAEEVNQQLAESLPLLIAAVREQTGRDPIGMRAEEFMDAVIKAGEGKYGNAAGSLSAASPMIAIQNLGEMIMNSMIPTGKRLTEMLSVLMAGIEPMIKMWTWLNETLMGIPGLILIVGLLTISMKGLAASMRGAIAHSLRKNVADLKQFNNLQMVNFALGVFYRRLQAASFGGGFEPLHYLRKHSPGRSAKGKRILNLNQLALTNQAPFSWLFGDLKANANGTNRLKIGLSALKNVPQTLKTLNFTKLLKFSGWLLAIGLAIGLAIDSAPKRGENLGKIFKHFYNKMMEWGDMLAQNPVVEAVKRVIDAITAIWEQLVSIVALDWLVSLLGIEDDSKGKANADKVRDALGSTADRPIRRGDAEVWWQSRLADMR